jgi:GDP-L-fucose synthase
MPTNLYGPGDSFDLNHSHVIPALIRKMIEAQTRGDRTVTLWGDGSPTREFLYVQDAAEGIARAAAYYDSDQPVNLGSQFEISIKDLALMIAREVGFEGDIVWDTSKPNGQPRRKLDVSRAEREFGFRARTTFADGLRQTVAWYRAQLAAGVPVR